MRIVDLIEKKRDGGSHSREELEAIVGGYVRGEVPDYQIAAWLMAVCWQGMQPDEVASLTQVMAASGEQLDLSSIGRPVADKHSTGGVGDKTSLIVMPLVAACGVPVGKMSGRGLGFTGGTIDKLESFPGIRVDLDAAAFTRQLREVGIVITGQSADLAPADGKLYALRDVTGTVPSLPLIASSVMSKKLAAGANVIVLDVKTGSGAFMREPEAARALARVMVDIGAANGRRMAAIVSDMSQPLGRAVGNALEIAEALDTLEGHGPPELAEFAIELAALIVQLAAEPVANEATSASNGSAAVSSDSRADASQSAVAAAESRSEPSQFGAAAGDSRADASQSAAAANPSARTSGQAARLANQPADASSDAAASESEPAAVSGGAPRLPSRAWGASSHTVAPPPGAPGESARARVERALASGDGLRAFRAMIEAQGGDSRAFDDRSRLPRATIQHIVTAERDGYLSKLDALTIAHAATLLGAGRERKGDPIDLSVGVVIPLKIGDRVARGEPLAILHANDQTRLVHAEREVRNAVELSPRPVTPPPLILERLIAPSAGHQA